MEQLHLHFDVDGADFTSAGEASSELKRILRQLGVAPEVIRRCAISMYEGEINMVIHANGGTVDVYIDSDEIILELIDSGPGIPNVNLAMQEGYSTASQDVRDLGFGAGMGLPNMKRYADEFILDSIVGVGTAVIMSIKYR